MGTIDGDPTENYFIARVIMVVVSFGVNITLLNIFIAVLTASYEVCYGNAWRNFLDAQAEVGVRKVALNEGWRTLTDQSQLAHSSSVATLRPSSVSRSSKHSVQSSRPQG